VVSRSPFFFFLLQDRGLRCSSTFASRLLTFLTALNPEVGALPHSKAPPGGRASSSQRGWSTHPRVRGQATITALNGATAVRRRCAGRCPFPLHARAGEGVRVRSPSACRSKPLASASPAPPPSHTAASRVHSSHSSRIATLRRAQSWA